MPVMKRSFSELNPYRVGVAGVLALILVTVAALNSGPVIAYFTTTTYHAEFTEAGGLTAGDSVEVSGVTMGTVKSVALVGDNLHVDVTFDVRHGATLASLTGATISSATALGTKELALTSAGDGTLAPGSTIPLARTSSPYDLSQILSTLTTKASQVNANQAAQALDTIAATLKDTPPELRAALSGVRGLSQTIASRDTALTQLMSAASRVTGVLATRAQQVQALIADGDQLLAILQARRAEIGQLLGNITLVATQLKGVATDNQRQLAPALAQLARALTLLHDNAANITATINGLQRYTTSLGEAVGSGPWFYAYVADIVPTNLVPVLPGVFGK